MLSNPVMGIIVLLLVLAFILFPAYERFTDAKGREVDVDPNAPPMPDWLKGMPTREPPAPPTRIPSNVEVVPPVSVPPVDMSSTLGTTPGSTADMLSYNRPAPPAPPVASVLPTSSTNMTLPPPVYESMDGTNGMGSDYVKKSSLVPCTCTKHTMGCAAHSGASRSSVVPGDKDAGPTNSIEALSRAQNQFNVMKPFTDSFPNEAGGVQGFLNSFSAFTR